MNAIATRPLTNKPFPVVPLLVAAGVSLGVAFVIGVLVILACFQGMRKPTDMAPTPAETPRNIPTTPGPQPAKSREREEVAKAAPTPTPPADVKTAKSTPAPTPPPTAPKTTRSDNERIVGTWRTDKEINGQSYQFLVTYGSSLAWDFDFESRPADGSGPPSGSGTYSYYQGEVRWTLTNGRMSHELIRWVDDDHYESTVVDLLNSAKVLDHLTFTRVR